MMKNADLVSIILPVQNASEYLAQCLKSLLSQTHKNIEIIAIDDNSSDDSFEILKTFRKKDKRLRIFKNKKRYGLPICFNRALKHAQSTYVAFTDAKDVNIRTRIQKQIQFLKDNPKVVAVGTQCTFAQNPQQPSNTSSFPQDHEAIARSLLSGKAMQFETVMVNKYLFPKDILRFIPNSYPLFYIDAFMKLFEYGKFANLPHHLYQRRVISRKISKKTKKIKHLTSLSKLLIQSFTAPAFKPSYKDFFFPILRQI